MISKAKAITEVNKAKHSRRSMEWRRNKCASDIAYHESIKSRSREYHRRRYESDDAFRARRKLASKNRDHSRRSAEGSFTHEEWIRTCAVFDNCCAYCGADSKLTIEHVIPLSKGGTNYISNVIPACATCNSSKNATDVVEWYTRQHYYNKSKLDKILAYIGGDANAI